jgi:hypothetical protein
MLRWLTPDEFAQWLDARASLITTARLIRGRGIIVMPLEIKGLKGKALKAGGVFDRLNRAYDKLIEAGDAHAADVESLPKQIEGMHDDLTFMVQTLGNSVNGSGESAEKPKQEPETQIAAAASPAVEPATATFPGT